MNKTRVTILFFVVVLTIVVAKNLLNKRVEENKNAIMPHKPKLAIELLSPHYGTLSHSQTFLAQVEAQKSVVITTKLTGYIEKIHVTQSQEIKKGDRLVTIDSSELRSTLESLKTSLDYQKEDKNHALGIYERNQKLYRVGGLSKEQLDLSHIAFKGKQSLLAHTLANIQQIRNQLNYLHIKAPFDGFVTTLEMHSGDLALASKGIMRIHTHKQKLIFSYPAQSNAIAKGQKVLLNHQEIGTIENLYLGGLSDLAQAEVKLKTPLNLPLQTHITIEVITQQSKGCIIPNQAILYHQKGEHIITYKNRTFEAYPIDPILRNAQHTLIKECPAHAKIALASQSQLQKLLTLEDVYVLGETNE